MRKYTMVLLAVIIFRALPAQTNPQKDISAIRAARNASNVAIAKHDLKEIGKYWLKEFVVTAGNGGAMMGKDSVLAAFQKQFNTIPDISYVRTPEKITISDADTLAFETGKWVALKIQQKKPEWLGGNYSAMWWKRNGEWKLRSELFVTLKHY